MNKNIVHASIDVETTGFKAGIHEIIEMAVITYDKDYIVKDTFTTNIKPMRPELANPEALEVNGLTLEELKKAPNPQQARNTFFNWHEEVTGNALLIPLGHKYSFDERFLKIFFGDYYDSIFYYHNDDSMIIARALKKKGRLKVESCSLVNLCKHFGIKHKAHTAEGDALATIQLYKKLMEIF